MSRKDLMKGLMDDTPPAPSQTRVNTAKPRYSKGAIGAVSRSIDDLKRRAVVEVDARMIDGAGLKDRLDSDDAGLAELAASIAEYGQQVPVMAAAVSRRCGSWACRSRRWCAIWMTAR